MSNLLANEMFDNKGARENVYCDIMEGIENIIKISENTVVVTNDVFLDGINYGADTLKYMKLLGNINYNLAKIADEVIYITHSCATYYKKGKKKGS